MKEKIRKIMVNGGYSAIIAVVAMIAYLTAMYFANDYFNKVTEPATLDINDKGEIYISGFEAGEDEILYVLWETDGGSIKPLEEEDIFKEQYEKENMNYYYNTSLNKKIQWNKKDADGNNYSTSTIRAIVYRYDNKNVYNMEDYVNEFTITVTSKENKTVKAEKERYFSNPIRENSDGKWNQIYIIEENEKNITLRYRTGETIEEEMLALCWEADKKILKKTNISEGLTPVIKYEDESNDFLITTNTITIDKKNNGGEYVKAYLIDENVYEKYESGISEKEKNHIAETIINENIEK